jgi:hypothetical protein
MDLLNKLPPSTCTACGKHKNTHNNIRPSPNVNQTNSPIKP